MNAAHAFGLRESKRTYGPVPTPIAQGLVEIINTKDTKQAMPPKAQGLVNTHCNKTCTLKNCTYDRMSGGKGPKRSISGTAAKKTTFLDQTNHACAYLLPAQEEFGWWGSTLAPLTFLKAASKHAAKLNGNRMLHNVSDSMTKKL